MKRLTHHAPFVEYQPVANARRKANLIRMRPGFAIDGPQVAILARFDDKRDRRFRCRQFTLLAKCAQIPLEIRRRYPARHALRARILDSDSGAGSALGIFHFAEHPNARALHLDNRTHPLSRSEIQHGNGRWLWNRVPVESHDLEFMRWQGEPMRLGG